MEKKWFGVSRSRRRGVHESRRSGLLARIMEFLWPSMGWRALGRLILLKLRREAESPHRVAFGVAIGVGISFLPLPGLGLVVAAFLAWLLRASIAAAVVGQVVGNPWTFPFIWWSTYGLGRWIWPGDQSFHWSEVESLGWSYLASHMPQILNNVVLPLLIGGGILGSILALLTYAFVYWELWRFGKNRKARKRGKAG